MTSFLIPLFGLLLGIPMANAAITVRVGLVEEVQVNSHIRAGYEDIVSIKLTGAWPGVNCAADTVWFNAKEDPQFLATILQARATGSELKVYVDDSMPKLGTLCHVMTLAMP